MDPSSYYVDEVSPTPRLVLKSGIDWPTGLRPVNAIRVRVRAGYGTPADVPQVLKQAMLLLIGSLSEHREHVMVSQFAGQFMELPYGYPQLREPHIAPYMRWLA